MIPRFPRINAASPPVAIRRVRDELNLPKKPEFNVRTLTWEYSIRTLCSILRKSFTLLFISTGPVRKRPKRSANAHTCLSEWRGR